jgi:hypothetical protein
VFNRATYRVSPFSVLYLYLLRIAEFSEWGLCLVLDLVAKYTPVDDNERFSIMNLLDPVSGFFIQCGQFV